MLQLTPPSQRRTTTRTGFGSVLLSLTFHALIALLLWCLVITVTRPDSIFLTGSTWTGEQKVEVDITTAIASESEAAEGVAAPSMSNESTAALDALIAQAMQAETQANGNEPTLEPPSIEFFGTRGLGHRFVFVLDISYSMNARQGERFRRACDELLEAVSQLESGQSYYVYLFCWNLNKMFYNRGMQYVDVHPGHETQLRNWIYDVSLGAGTDPRRALSMARQMNPDAVFLLSDGEFNQPRSPLSESGWLDEQGERIDISVQEGVKRFFKDIPIHTIALENPFATSAMKSISEVTGGEFRYVKTGSLQPINSKLFVKSITQIDQKYRQVKDPTWEYQARLSVARELISDGELLYAEYIIRPLYHAPASKILNPKLLQEVLHVLSSEVGENRLEDFEQPTELRQIVAKGSS